MAKVQSNATQANEPVLDRAFIEHERNRFAGRALLVLVLLNGAGALILLMVIAQAPAATVHGKVAAAMLFFSVGAIFALLSAFLAYINRTMITWARHRCGHRQWGGLPDGDEHGGHGPGGEIKVAIRAAPR